MSAVTDYLKKDLQALVFVILGALLIIFPEELAGVIPYFLAYALIIYAVINIYVGLRYPDSDVSIGDAFLKIVLGFVILFLEDKSIGMIGILWALQSLYEVAGTIDEFISTRRFRPVKCAVAVFITILAVMLITDPFEHFSVHVIVLGLEIIAAALIGHKVLIPLFPDDGKHESE